MRGRALSVLLLLLLPAAALRCAGEGETSGPGVSVFRYRLNHDPPELDPARAHDITSEAVLYNVFDGLVELDPTTLAVVPSVAEGWDVSDDNRTYTFHLKQGVRFHNGREVEAGDVVWSFQRVLRPETRASRVWVFTPIEGAEAFRAGEAAEVSGLQALDRHTVRITLREPYAPFLAMLILEQASILPREVYEDAEESYREHPVGCGPFRFVSWKRGQTLVLEGFRDYHGEGPYLDRLEFRVIDTVLTALEEYRAGNLEMTDEIPSGMREALREEFGDQYRRWPQIGIRSIALNHARPPFAGNRKLRQALNHTIDLEYLLRVIDEGKDAPLGGVIPPSLAAYDPDLETYDYDPERARQLLAEAGYPGGEGLPELSLLYNTHAGHKRMCERIAADLAEVGVRVRLTSVDLAQYLTRIAGTPETPPPDEMIYFAWVGDYPDAHTFLFPLLHSSNAGGGENYSRYRNPEFDALVDRAVRTADPQRRRELYRQAERIIVEDAAWIFVYSYQDEALVRPEVEGLLLSPLGEFASPFNLVRLRPRAAGR